METPTTPPIAQSPILHRQVMDTLDHINTDTLVISPDTTKLVPFNGYYSLKNAPGAFFAIDANMSVRDHGKTSTIFINLIVSTDGKTAYSTCFSNGTFDGTTLIQQDETFSIHLTLNRANASEAITASCNGTVQLGVSEVITPIQGSTYNNPIESALFAGTYYLPPDPMAQKNPTFSFTKVLEISADNSILYDFGSGDGNLRSVEEYTYNMNMYYYTFDNKKHSLIMGTAGSLGFACNNMIKSGESAMSRSLQTITIPITNSSLSPNQHCEELAAFSGYYPLTAIHPAAFFVVLGQYTVIGTSTIYSATISYSFDGKTSFGYSFGTEGMSFEGNILKIVDPAGNPYINLTFERSYSSEDMSLASISGTIADQTIVRATTPFNPVPLSAFSGAPMIDSNSSLTIAEDGLVTYITTPSGGAPVTTKMVNYIYVPLMYILANPWLGTTTVLSLGTSATQGTACIVVDVTTNTNSFLFAIPQSS